VQSLTEATGPQQQRSVVAKQLQPTQATTNAPLSATNLLHEIDGGAQDVIARISAAQVHSNIWFRPRKVALFLWASSRSPTLLCL